jgi:hypothetical protein
VGRPGGTIGMITFTPEGMAGDFFELFGRFAPPPPPGAEPPILWGVEEHVRELFGDRVSLRFTRDTYVERRPGGPQGFLDFYKQTFGPVVAIYAGLDDERSAELDAEALEFAERWNTAAPGGPAALEVEYLLIVGRRL